jgi:hypothetical protein
VVQGNYLVVKQKDLNDIYKDPRLGDDACLGVYASKCRIWGTCVFTRLWISTPTEMDLCLRLIAAAFHRSP